MHSLHGSDVANHLVKINVIPLFCRVSTNCWVADTSPNNQSSWRPNISRRKPKIASRQPVAYACCEHKYCFPPGSTIRNQWILLFNKREKNAHNARFILCFFPFANQLSVVKRQTTTFDYIVFCRLVTTDWLVWNNYFVVWFNQNAEWLQWKLTLHLVRLNHESSLI